MGINLHDLGLGYWFLDLMSESKQQQKKLDKLDCNKIKNLLCIKRHYQGSEKTVNIMGENICKSYIW